MTRVLSRRLLRLLLVSRDHLGRRPLPRPRMGVRVRVRLLHRDDVRAARGPHGPALVTRSLRWIGGAALVALPLVYRSPYPLHILIVILIWSFAYTSWSVMGRFGLVSLGHGGFMGIGAYVTALAWNHGHVSPWIGIPLALPAGAGLAGGVGGPSFR